MKVTIPCESSVYRNIHQLFPCLKSSVSDILPSSCELVLEYPDDAKLSPNFKEEFNKCFKSYLSRDPDLFRGSYENESKGLLSTERSSKHSRNQQQHLAINSFDTNGTQQRNIPNIPGTSSETGSSQSLLSSKKRSDHAQTANFSNTPPVVQFSLSAQNVRTISPLATASSRKEHSEEISFISRSTGCKTVIQPMPSISESELRSHSLKEIEMMHERLTSEFKCSVSAVTYENEKEIIDANEMDTGTKFTNYLESLKHCECEYLCKGCKIHWCYIEYHLINCKQNGCPLWRLCLRKGQYDVYKFAPERMVLFSRNENKIGTISNDYNDYSIGCHIGMGGFGRVFHHSVNQDTSVAVKEEKKSRSLISSLQRFKNVLDMDHPNVLLIKEYVVGHQNHDTKAELSFLLVMTHYDQRGLNEPFIKDKKKKCLLDYMSLEMKKAPYYFRNILVISIDLFTALIYFAERRLVHRDIKRSNILLELKCGCPSAIECMCSGKGGAKALLSDFDLVEKATRDEQWARLGDSEPDGTRGMKAPELFFVNENGKVTFTGKADIWSAFLTIIHVMLGRNVNDISLQKVTEFFQVTTTEIHESAHQIQLCIQSLQKYCDECTGDDHLIVAENIPSLQNIQRSIEKLCRFQGGRQPKSSEKEHARANYCPVAEVLTALHGVSMMPQICINEIPEIFQDNNPLQESIKELWNIVQNGLCFHPEERPDAEHVVGQLNDCLNKFLKNYFE